MNFLSNLPRLFLAVLMCVGTACDGESTAGRTQSDTMTGGGDMSVSQADGAVAADDMTVVQRDMATVEPPMVADVLPARRRCHAVAGVAARTVRARAGQHVLVIRALEPSEPHFGFKFESR